MIFNTGKFQPTIIDRKNQKNNPQTLTIDEKLLCLEFDSKPNFDLHISKICNKSTGQLNAFGRIGY